MKKSYTPKDVAKATQRLLHIDQVEKPYKDNCDLNMYMFKAAYMYDKSINYYSDKKINHFMNEVFEYLK